MEECRTGPIRLAGRAALPLQVDVLRGLLTMKDSIHCFVLIWSQRRRRKRLVTPLIN